MPVYTRGRESADLSIAAAVTAVGCGLDPARAPQVFSGGRGPSVVFYFSEVSDCGRFRAEDLLRLWADEVFFAGQPAHPWSYLKRALENRARLLKFVKDGEPSVEVYEGTGYRLRPLRELPEGATRGSTRLEREGRQAVAAPAGGLTSMDIDVVAGFLGMGFPLVSVGPWGNGMGPRGPRVMWHVGPRSACGKMEAQPIWQAWSDEEWRRAHTDHPLSYVVAGFENRRRLLDYVEAAVPMGQMEKRGKTGYLSLDATDEEQRVFFRELNRR